MKRLFIAFGITLIIGLLIFLVSTFFKPKDTKLEEEDPVIEEKTYEFDISYAEEIALEEASSKIEENEKVLILLGKKDEDATKKVSSLLKDVEIKEATIYYIEKEEENEEVYQSLMNTYPNLSNYLNFAPVILVFKDNELLGGLPSEVEEKNLLNFLEYTKVI